LCFQGFGSAGGRWPLALFRWATVGTTSGLCDRHMIELCRRRVAETLYAFRHVRSRGSRQISSWMTSARAIVRELITMIRGRLARSSRASSTFLPTRASEHRSAPERRRQTVNARSAPH